MAATKTPKKAIDLLLLTVERGRFNYITIPANFRDEASGAKKIIADLIQQLVPIVDSNARPYIHGVYYVSTKPAPLVAVPYFEIEGATPEINKDGQLFINDIAKEEAAKLPSGRTGKSSGRQGYTGIQIEWV